MPTGIGQLIKPFIYHRTDKVHNRLQQNHQDGNQFTYLGIEIMSTIPKSIKCSLVIDEKSVGMVIKKNERDDQSSTLRAICMACLVMLKSYHDSDDCNMSIGFKQIHGVNMALENEISEYLKGRIKPETKYINLKFKDENSTDQRISFKLMTVF